MIGGATTSARHTAVKIAPQYHGTVIHVKDASKSVGVVDRLGRPDARDELDAQNRAAQERERDAFGQRVQRKLVPYAEAVERRLRDRLERDRRSPSPRSWARGRSRAIPLEEIVPFIDWSPFFLTWELKGKYPRIFDDPELGPRARELFDDAQALLRQIVAEKRLTANAVYGFFPANTEGDDIVVYTDESRHDRADAVPDAAAAVGARRPDLVPVAGRLHRPARDRASPTTWARSPSRPGSALESLVEQFERDHDDYNAIMSKALADRLAEALAEMLHKRAREDWGFGRDERLTHRRPDRREIPGHPAGLGLPELPRPHREARPVAAARRREGRRDRPDRVVRDVSRAPRSAASTSPIPRPATSPSTSSPATRSRTTRPARACRSARSSAGWRPTWRTIRIEHGTLLIARGTESALVDDAPPNLGATFRASA